MRRWLALLALSAGACLNDSGASPELVVEAPTPSAPASPSEPSSPANPSEPSAPAEPSTPPPEPVPPDPLDPATRNPTGFEGRVMGRAYVSALLREVFMPAGGSERLEQALDGVGSSPSTYGGPCNVYGSRSGNDCEEVPIVASGAAQYPPSTTVRQLDKLAVCEAILDRDSHVEAAAGRAGGMSAEGLAPLDAAAIERAYGLFYRSAPVSAERLSLTRQFVERLSAEGASALDAWRALLQIICEQPGWETV